MDFDSSGSLCRTHLGIRSPESLSIVIQDPPGSLGRILSLAPVAVKLLLEISLGILGAHQCT